MVYGVQVGYMEQNTDSTDDSEEVEAYRLKVSKDTVINGLKISSRPGEERTVLFPKQIGGGRGDGKLRDVRGLRWDGDAPIQIAPKSFLPRDFASDPSGLVHEARSEAKKEGEDPDEWEEVAMETWEGDARRALKEEIVVPARFEEDTKTVYEIEYVEGSE